MPYKLLVLLKNNSTFLHNFKNFCKIDKSDEKIVGIQTDSPLKRLVNVHNSINESNDKKTKQNDIIPFLCCFSKS